MNDLEVLRKAYDREHDIRDRRPPGSRSWEFYSIGATRADIRRLVDDGMVCIAVKGEGLTRYRLTEKANKLVWSLTMEHEFEKVPASSVLEAMDLVVGFGDIKITLAQAIAMRHRTNFLLEGPPACAKSIMLEGVRSAVPGAYLAFGSRTSASGLSDALFENHPYVLLLDEADKMDNDVYSVLLGLMESGEVIETKSRRSRGLKLETMVIAACNSSERMPREFLSRFALHVHFPTYSRSEFIDVCRGFLAKAENCPTELAEMIGKLVYDRGLGDVRKARGVWQLMTAPTQAEVERVVGLMQKYGPKNDRIIGRRRSGELPPALL